MPERERPTEQDKLFDTAEFRETFDEVAAGASDHPTPPPGMPPASAEESDGEGFFGSPGMRTLFFAQLVAALGDWIGVVALLAIADRLVRGTALDTFGAGFVLMSRLLPGLVLAPAAGVLVDRLDRRKVMVVCNVGRGFVIMAIPFAGELWMLLIASLLLEVGQLMFMPAKEASVPHLVRGRYVQRANQMSLAASYATFPVAAAIFAGLAKVAALLGTIAVLRSFQVNQESLALFLNAITFFTSAYLVSTLSLPGAPVRERKVARRRGLADEWQDLKDGVRFIIHDDLVRTIMAGLGAALLGAGAVVSLGPTFVRELLAGGAAGFGLVLFGLGVGAGVGMLIANLVAERLSPVAVFTGSCTLAGGSLFLAASMSSLSTGLLFIVCLGCFGAPGYAAGFTLIHHHVDDQMRGRVFAALLTVIRFSMVFSLALAPFAAGIIDRLVRLVFGGTVINLGAFTINLAGVRVTLWMAGLLIAGAGLWAGRELVRKGTRPARPPIAELPPGVDSGDTAHF